MMMAGVRKLAYAAVLCWVVIPLACAQDAVTTIQLADGTSTQVTFTRINVPGSQLTTVTGINAAGDMVGYYGKNSNGPYHGFLLSGGKFTFFNYPGAHSTVAGKINDAGVIVGNTANGGPRELGFSYDGTSYTSIRRGKDAVSVPIGINNAGYIVGGTGMSDTQAFELRGTQFRMIDFPGLYFNGYGTGINRFGQVVGWTTDGVHTHGYEYSQGVFTQIDFPGSQATEAWDINDSGVIVGWYGVGAFTYGFVLLDGQYTEIAYPGAKGTFAEGINAAGQIVGSYTFDYTTYHGFVTSPIATLR
jgi:probable HAF family extracellular repeat protein